jgi:pimeloyl-ACP methyl ester carboxylesterase
MSSYILVHGSWHGAWCWNKVIPLLEERGHEVRALDLAGHGQDRTPASDVTLVTYVRQVEEALDAWAEPAILVGHSHGGIVITQAAEYCAERIRSLVYLSGYLPADGQSLMDWALRDTRSILVRSVVPSDDGLTLNIGTEVALEAFYGDCSPEDAAWATSSLVPEPSSSYRAPIAISAERFGSLPRLYIKCLRDRAVTPAIQERMLEQTPCAVRTMDTGHSPFLSAPSELVDLLLTAP